MSNDWCTIESDPAVFSELISLFGVQNAEVEEIYSLDTHEQALDQRSFGLIFLFKYVEEADDRLTLSHEDCPELFYAKQVIQNACATQAILSILMNAEGIELGDTLRDFKSFTMAFSPEMKGLAIGNSDVMRRAHNAFAASSAFDADTQPRKDAKKGDAYHFIAYIPHNGIVYELDGLKGGPIILGAAADEDHWFTVAKPAIEERMQRYSASETSFALLNICPKRRLLFEGQLRMRRSELAEECISEERKSSLEMEVHQLEESLAEEHAKALRQKEENARRRHDYVPFTITLLRLLSERGKLKDLVASGRARASEAAGRKRNRGAN